MKQYIKNQAIHLTILHAFLKDPIPLDILGIAWQVLHGVVCWTIWKSWNDHYIPIPPICWNKQVVGNKIWSRFCVYLQNKWDNTISKSKRLGLPVDWELDSFKQKFGSNTNIFTIVNDRITIQKKLPFLP